MLALLVPRQYVLEGRRNAVQRPGTSPFRFPEVLAFQDSSRAGRRDDGVQEEGTVSETAGLSPDPKSWQPTCHT